MKRRKEFVPIEEQKTDSPGIEGIMEPKTKKGMVSSVRLLNIWMQPEANSNHIGYLERGDRVVIEEEIDEFFKVFCKSKRLRGYVMKKYIAEV